MKNRLIFASVALLARFTTAKTGVNLEEQSKINPTVNLTKIVLSNKCLDEVGY